jgi:hypothetical protein
MVLFSFTYLLFCYYVSFLFEDLKIATVARVFCLFEWFIAIFDFKFNFRSYPSILYLSKWIWPFLWVYVIGERIEYIGENKLRPYMP